MQTFQLLNHLLGGVHDVSIFTDHPNLLFIFHPTAVESSVGCHKLLNFIRCTLYLSAFSYTIEHVLDKLRTIGDIMTLWKRVYRNSVPAVQHITRLGMSNGSHMVQTVPYSLAKFPSRALICEVQLGSPD